MLHTDYFNEWALRDIILTRKTTRYIDFSTCCFFNLLYHDYWNKNNILTVVNKIIAGNKLTAYN